MATRDQINSTRPVSIYGSVIKNLSTMPQHPLHDVSMALATEQNNAAFLRLAQPVEGLHIEVPAAALLGWLDGAGLTSEFLRDLQCISQTKSGEPLLTAWVPWPRFEESLARAGGHLTGDLRVKVKDWREHRLDEVYFDFFKRTEAKPPKRLLSKRERLYAEGVAAWNQKITRHERRREQCRMMRRSLTPTYPNPFECCEGQWDVSRQHWACTAECIRLQGESIVEA